VVWQDHAKAEFKEAVGYYRAHAGTAVAQDFSDQTRRVTRRLREQPELGMRIAGDTRRYPLHDYPYHLIYRLVSGAIIVVALAHQRRRPGYWAGRR
jgi:toxin ParE1/3/4